MKVKRLIYIANARLPTEKAYGFQICKMCEAFVRNGVSVLLMHPKRYQPDQTLRQKNIFDYYSISSHFELCTLPNLDIVRLNSFIPGKLFTPFFFTHA